MESSTLEAKAFLKKIKQPYKIELIDKFVEQQGIKQVSFYENIREADNKPLFVDLCEGGRSCSPIRDVFLD